MDGDFDYLKLDDSELCEMVGRIDPRVAPLNYLKFKTLLEERGYVVHESDRGGPSFATLSPEKRQSLIGSPNALSFSIRFGPTKRRTNWLEPARNELRLVGTGNITVDGLFVEISGRRFDAFLGVFGFLFKRHVQLPWRSIVNVEAQEDAVRFEYVAPGQPRKSVALWLSEPKEADALSLTLPRARTTDFSPQLPSQLEFERVLVARAPRTPVTQCLIGANGLVFLAMGFSGAGWLDPSGSAIIPWGANFGPYTTAGDWWRPMTGMFVHLGLIHVVCNMWALGSFGPVVERLYGSVRYSVLYLSSGLVGALTSISWNPAINSVGASGAIFGVLGALLAVQFRTDNTIPIGVMRPLRTSTLIFAVAALISGLLVAGVDNADHFGGLTAGFLVGLTLARPVIGSVEKGDRNWRQLAVAIVIGGAILAAAGGMARYRANSLRGDALYLRTTHWFGPREVEARERYNALADEVSRKALSPAQFAAGLESGVIPIWVEARVRFNAVDMPRTDHLYSRLDFLRQISEKRIAGYRLCARAMHINSDDAFSVCNAEQKQIDTLIRNWNPPIEVSQ